MSGISAAGDSVVWIIAHPKSDMTTHPVMIFRSIDAGKTWDMNDFQFSIDGNNMQLEAVNATTAWILRRLDNSTSGRLYKTEDGGKEWMWKLTHPAANGAIKVFDDMRLACYDGRSIARSDDGGVTWEYEVVFDDAQSINGLFPLTASGSTAGDTAWFAMGVPNDIEYLSVAPRALIRITDYGRNVQHLNFGLDSLVSIDFVSFSDHLNGIIHFSRWKEMLWSDEDYGDYTYYTREALSYAVSSDGGQSWTDVVPYPGNQTTIDISAVPRVPGLYFILRYSGISWTENNGQSWHTEALPYSICCIDFSSPVTGWAAVNRSESTDPLVLKWNGDVVSDTKDQKSKEPAEIRVFPIPASDVIYYSLDGEIPQTHIVNISDSAGKMVFARESNRQELDISELPAGLYILQLKSDAKVKVGKFMKY